MGRRTGSAPVASSSRSYGTVPPSASVSVLSFGLQSQIDMVVAVEIIRPQRQPVCWRAAGEIILGEVRPVDRRRIVIAQHHDAAAKVLTPQHLGCCESGGAAADDHHLVRHVGRRAARLGLWRDRLLDENRVALPLDLPAGERAQRRCVQRLAGADVEAGVMPRAADRAAVHDALGERPVIMRAFGADREHLRACAHQQHGRVADMAEQRLTVTYGAEPHALHEIRTGGFLLVHGALPCWLRLATHYTPVTTRPPASGCSRPRHPDKPNALEGRPWTLNFPKSSARSKTWRALSRATR
jgi:hypothetical protein